MVLSVLWGGSFFLGEIALQGVLSFTLVLGRVGIAAIVLIAIVYASGQRMPSSPHAWGAYFMMGALNNIVPFSLIFWGQTQIASGLAAILNATTPLFTVILAHFLTADETMTARRFSGVLLGLFGVAVMIGPGVLAGFGLYDAAQLCVLGAALSHGCAGIFGRRFAKTSPLVTAAGQLSASTVLILPLALLIDRPWTLAPPSLAIWAALIGLALLCTALAYLIYFRILATAGATNLLLVTFLIPVSAVLLGAVFLGERLNIRHGLGLTLIGSGLVAIGGRKSIRHAGK